MARTTYDIESDITEYSGASADKHRVAAFVTTRRHLFNEWLEANGIPAVAAARALPQSVVDAYCAPKYLAGWRRRVNPNWSLIGKKDSADIDLEFADGGISLDSVSQPAAPPVSTDTDTRNGKSAFDLNDLAKAADTVIGRRMAEAQSNLSAQLKRDLADALATTKLELSQAAKDAIIAIAKDSAASKIAELMPPREIIVKRFEEDTEGVKVGITHFMFEKLLRICTARNHRGLPLNIMLVGPTGSGKSTACEQVAQALKCEFHCESSLDADYKFVGFRDANGNFQSTGSLKIIEHGGVLVCDEIDNWNPSALLCFNALLASGYIATPAGLIKRHRNCVIIACGNTWSLGATSDYVGRERMDAASLDRFKPRLLWPYDEDMEKAVAKDLHGDEGYQWFTTVRAAREKVMKQQGLQVIVSPRATYDGIALLRAGFAREEVIEMTLTSGLSDEQATAIGLSRVTRAAERGPASTKVLTSEQENNVRYYIRRGNKIEAIKQVRQYLAMNLAEAKEYVERLEITL